MKSNNNGSEEQQKKQQRGERKNTLRLHIVQKRVVYIVNIRQRVSEMKLKTKKKQQEPNESKWLGNHCCFIESSRNATVRFNTRQFQFFTCTRKDTFWSNFRGFKMIFFLSIDWCWGFMLISCWNGWSYCNTRILLAIDSFVDFTDVPMSDDINFMHDEMTTQLFYTFFIRAAHHFVILIHFFLFFFHFAISLSIFSSIFSHVFLHFFHFFFHMKKVVLGKIIGYSNCDEVMHHVVVQKNSEIYRLIRNYIRY